MKPNIGKFTINMEPIDCLTLLLKYYMLFLHKIGLHTQNQI